LIEKLNWNTTLDWGDESNDNMRGGIILLGAGH
jgi:hypothetical protein